MAPYERPYRGQDSHTVSLFGTEWTLPIVEVETGTYIASDARLVLGTTPFVRNAGRELATTLEGQQLEYLVTPEAKALPLTQVMAAQLEMDYAVVRKSVKNYMTDPYSIGVTSITSPSEQQLVLNGPVAEELRSARVGIVDDAVSTGDTMRALETLLENVGADIVAKAAVFEEGEEHPNVETLARLPLFKRD